MRAAVLAIALAGCYSPSPPSGAYTCASDGACPSGQSCVCGLCVSNPADGVCKLQVDVGGAALTVNEHQTFPVTITAHNAAGGNSAGFNGTVALSFELPDHSAWCDVSPSSVKLSGGTATVNVSLNRETVPPEQPALTARLLTASGSADSIVVVAPPFTRDAAPIVAPLAGSATFGWGQKVITTPGVWKKNGQYVMYFASLAGVLSDKLSIGYATSSDGISFTPAAQPILLGQTGVNYHAYATPTPYQGPDGVAVLVSDGRSIDPTADGAQIARIVSSDGESNFSAPSPNVVPCAADSYCGGRVGFPSVLPDPSLTPADAGVPGGWLLYFVATSSMKNGIALPGIGVATSSDGKTFTPEPSAVLNGDLGGEARMLAPLVWVDSSVYKMLYSFTRTRDISVTNVCNYSIGYATSTDGRYWVRSPSNSPTAAIAGPGGSGWDSTASGFIGGSVLVDDTGAIVLYYSVMQPATSMCIPNGIGRATRP